MTIAQPPLAQAYAGGKQKERKIIIGKKWNLIAKNQLIL